MKLGSLVVVCLLSLALVSVGVLAFRSVFSNNMDATS